MQVCVKAAPPFLVGRARKYRQSETKLQPAPQLHRALRVGSKTRKYRHWSDTGVDGLVTYNHSGLFLVHTHGWVLDI